MFQYDSGLAKASQIQNPIFRYLHENSGLRKDELYVLWSMLQAIYVDFGALLLDQFKRQVQPSKGTISIGGMITPIAMALDMNLANYQPLPGPRALNLTHLRNVRMISPNAAPIELIIKDGRKFPLPNPALTSVTNFEDQRNWLMNTPEHNALMIAPEPMGVHLQRENAARRAPRGQRRNRGDVADERLESLEGMMTTMNQNFTNFQGNVFTQFTDMRADLDARLTDMRENVDNRFTDMQANIDERFQGLQSHMDGRFSGMRTEFQELQSNYSNLHGDYSHLRSDVSDIATMMRQWGGIGSSSQNSSQTFTPPFPLFQQYPFSYSGPFQFPQNPRPRPPPDADA
ncbi:hypothetical protein C2S51_014193 [Perilla frutescens var. frutescens]|nr:hypothetical protein C2S51_014193 [Perilla frutescens var. frutescens]